jgi:hypothetical protein
MAKWRMHNKDNGKIGVVGGDALKKPQYPNHFFCDINGLAQTPTPPTFHTLIMKIGTITSPCMYSILQNYSPTLAQFQIVAQDQEHGVF